MVTAIYLENKIPSTQGIDAGQFNGKPAEIMVDGGNGTVIGDCELADIRVLCTFVRKYTLRNYHFELDAKILSFAIRQISTNFCQKLCCRSLLHTFWCFEASFATDFKPPDPFPDESFDISSDFIEVPSEDYRAIRRAI